MSNLSDDEDDFLSADEESFVEEKSEVKMEKKPDANKKSHEIVDNRKDNSQDRNKKSNEAIETSKHSAGQTKIEAKSKFDFEQLIDDVDDDEERKLAERIKERNLKIAKKFLKVETNETQKKEKDNTTEQIFREAVVKEKKLKSQDISYPQLSPLQSNSEDKPFPPAPPPTPAADTKTDHASSQYPWRQSEQQKRAAAIEAASKAKDPLSELSKSVLDRLSNNLSGTEKNLLDQIVTDLKKVSIKPDGNKTKNDSQTSASDSSGIEDCIPILSDLGLNNLSWANASKLLSSATVGSVLDSVKHLAQQSETVSSKSDSSSAGSTSPKSISTTEESSKMSSSEPNDDFLKNTFSAVEKAFGAMTERDKSGNLRLSKPLERLGSIFASQVASKSVGQSSSNSISSPDSSVTKKDYNFDHAKLD